MSKKQLYIAYGSNINLDQMAYRCPHSKVVGTSEIKGYELEFRGVATIVPKENAKEASFIEGLEVYPANSLEEVIKMLSGELDIAPVECLSYEYIKSMHKNSGDFAYIKGQASAKRALEIAAAGRT